MSYTPRCPERLSFTKKYDKLKAMKRYKAPLFKGELAAKLTEGILAAGVYSLRPRFARHFFQGAIAAGQLLDLVLLRNCPW